eukprot:Phypoly_transcript_05570.p1 GENE.Phypoly_transcript_05570~~Phypoly_transcript_05570.p1  ORF type:complete len:633 (+),score=134.04 Phypoly_transcript_05570:129-1901(+)
MRVLLAKEREKNAFLEKNRLNTPPAVDHGDITDEDIQACVKVLKFLKSNAKEIEGPRFREVTECVEAAYRSRIILAFVSRAQRNDAGLRKKPPQPHILRSLDEMKRKSCRIHTPGKPGKQYIPTSAQLLTMDEKAREEDEEEEKREAIEKGEEVDKGEEIEKGMIEGEWGEQENSEMRTGYRRGEEEGKTKEKGEVSEGGETIQRKEETKQNKRKGERKEEGLELVNNDLNEELLVKGQCYICHKLYTKLHFFYSSMCVACAEINYAKRSQSSDLRGKVAIVTGGRIKVGYATSLKLLRCGATVVVTTRFPRHALLSFSQEPDFIEWSDRLKLYGPLDFCNTKSVENFVEYVKSNFAELHILVNNAAQTVARPPEYYHALYRLEGAPQTETSKKILCILPATSTVVSEAQANEIIANGIAWEGEVLDLRERNSWHYQMDEVSTTEMMEVQAVNVIAPFVLCSKLKSLMVQSRGMKFIINVSAMEGKFYRLYKSTSHPHTNMAKAALNMMTRTSAPDFAGKNIFMNSVDPGWVSNVGGGHKYEIFANGKEFTPPIDITDAAARVCDPIFQALNGNPPVFGLFLKDYTDTQW